MRLGTGLDAMHQTRQASRWEICLRLVARLKIGRKEKTPNNPGSQTWLAIWLHGSPGLLDTTVYIGERDISHASFYYGIASLIADPRRDAGAALFSATS